MAGVLGTFVDGSEPNGGGGGGATLAFTPTFVIRDSKVYSKTVRLR